MKRPLGCRGPGYMCGVDARDLVGGEDAPPSADLRGPWTRYPEQRGSSCFGHAWAQACRTQSRGALDPSAMAIWSLARETALVRPDTSTPLPDEGVYGHDVLGSMRELGIVDRARWPDDVETSLWVPQDVVEAGQCARIDAIYGIDEADAELESRIRQIVGLAGHPVVFGMDVDASYMRIGGDGIWRGAQGPSEGGHAQCIDYYDADYVGVAGSWGIGWSAGGRAYIPWPVFRTMSKYDFQAATFLPTRAT